MNKKLFNQIDIFKFWTSKKRPFPRNEDILREYDESRRKVDTLRKEMIHDYYNKKFDKSRKNPKTTCKLINEVITDDHNKKKELIKLKNDDHVLISDAKMIANEFNDYYTNIGEDLASRINETNQPDILNLL